MDRPARRGAPLTLEVVAAGVVGYLLGSLSSARFVGRLVAPGTDVTRVAKTLASGDRFEIASASGTAVQLTLGARWGALTGTLDALKVAVPMLAARALGFGVEVEVAIAVGGLVGHVLPIWHRFHGGRGEAPTYGAILTLDPTGVLISLAIGMAFGFVVGNILALRWAPLVALIGFAAVIRDDALFATYVAFALLFYVWASWGELTQLAVLAKKGTAPGNEEIAAELGMGGGLGRAVDRWSVPGLVRRLRGGRGDAV